MHTRILRRCGIVLIIIGALDVAYMAWCIANQISYRSSLNIFALVGGVFLYRGGLKTASRGATLLTFLLTASVLGLIVMPFMYPLGYWIAVLKHGDPLSGLISMALLALLFWVRQQLMHPAVLEAQQSAGVAAPRIKFALVGGVLLPLLLVTLLGLMFKSDTAQEAMKRAKQQLGPQYQYVVTSMQMSSNMKGKRVFALVTAYNDREIKTLQVHWEE